MDPKQSQEKASFMAPLKKMSKVRLVSSALKQHKRAKSTLAENDQINNSKGTNIQDFLNNYSNIEN